MPAIRPSATRSSKPMAARCCWASARPRLWIVHGARHDRGGKRVSGGMAGETLAGSGRLRNHGGCFRYPDRCLAALVDNVGCDLRGCVHPLDGAVTRREGFPAIAEASDLRLAYCAVCARGSRNALVGCAMGDKALRHRSAVETADVAAAVLSF